MQCQLGGTIPGKGFRTVGERDDLARGRKSVIRILLWVSTLVPSSTFLP